MHTDFYCSDTFVGRNVVRKPKRDDDSDGNDNGESRMVLVKCASGAL